MMSSKFLMIQPGFYYSLWLVLLALVYVYHQCTVVLYQQLMDSTPILWSVQFSICSVSLISIRCHQATTLALNFDGQSVPIAKLQKNSGFCYGRFMWFEYAMFELKMRRRKKWYLIFEIITKESSFEFSRRRICVEMSSVRHSWWAEFGFTWIGCLFYAWTIFRQFQHWWRSTTCNRIHVAVVIIGAAADNVTVM